MIRFPFFAKKIPKSEEIDDLNDEQDPDQSEDNGRYYYKLWNGDLFSLVPGDILRVYYIDSEKIPPGSPTKTILITATERGPRGNFISTRDKDLLCCFELNANSFAFKVILKALYKKENRCKYKLLPSFLKFVFGLSAFKTLDFNKIMRKEILLKKK